MTNKEILANYEKMKNECFETRKLNNNLGELVVEKNRIIADLEDKLANADYQLEGRDNEIRELKARIEKMVNEIDKTMVLSNMRECEICDIQDIFRKNGFKRNEEKWELAE